VITLTDFEGDRDAIALCMALSLPSPRLAGVLATSTLAGLLTMRAGRVRRSLRHLREAIGLIRDRNGRSRLWHALRVRAYSRHVAFGLRRDLRVPVAVPAAKIPLVVRPLRPQDDLAFLSPEPGLPLQSAWGRLAQRRLLAANLATCWIAADPNGTVCYMQWLVAAHDNARVQAHWAGGLFPLLQQNEALLEGAYTAETHRGQGVMAHSMAKIAAAAQELGAQSVITFVEQSNVPSLKGCEKAGFAPYVKRTEIWFLFRRRVRFAPI
jgi:GNAT superfamily N-acetyltransferase